MILNGLKVNQKVNIQTLLKNYNTTTFVNEKNKNKPKIVLLPSVPKPENFNICEEKDKLHQIKLYDRKSLDNFPNAHYIGLMFSSVLSTNAKIKDSNFTVQKQLYSNLIPYLNNLLKIILRDNNRKSKLTVNELNSLLVSLANVKALEHNSQTFNIDMIIELIFSHKPYKSGYNSYTIDELLIVIVKANNAPLLYEKVTNFLIRDNFKFNKHNLQYLIYKLNFFKQYQVIDNLLTFLINNQSENLTIPIFEELIKGYCIDNKLDSAEKLFLKVKQNNLKPSPAIYAWLVTGYGKRKNYKLVIKNLNDYLSSYSKFNSSMAPVQAAIRQLSQSANNLRYVEKLIQKTVYFKKDLDYYNAMIHYNVFKGDIEIAKNILQTMKQENFSPNVYSYNRLLDYFVKTRDLREMKKLYANFMSSYKNTESNITKAKMKNTAKLFTTKYIELACNLMIPKFAESLIIEAKQNHVVLSPIAYFSLIQYYSDHNQPKKVIQLYNDIKASKIGNDNMIFHIYLKSIYEIYGVKRGFDEFFKMLRLKNRKPVEIDIIMNAHRIGSYGTAKDLVEFFTHELIKPVLTKGCYDAAYHGLLSRQNHDENDINQILKFDNLNINTMSK